MRICLYTNTALPVIGGQEVVVDELARQYQSLGHDVVVLCPDPPRSRPTQDHQLPYPVERHFRFVSTRWFVNWYELALKRLYRSFPYDLIHCHNVYPNAYLAVKHRLRGGPPVVITSHGGDVRIDNPRFRKPGLLERHRLAVQGADALISIGSFTDQGFLRLGAHPQKMHSIPNGVHVQAYAQTVVRPTTLPAQISSRNYHLFLGRLVHLKGVDVLLKAAALQPHETTDDTSLPHVVIAGDGKERAPLEQLCQELGQSHRVTFLGNVGGDTKRWLLQNALSLVIPSREREAFPMVLLEGFASGCTVIASDAPGLASLVAHRQTGWVVPRSNPQALAETLQHVSSRPNEANVVAQAGKQVAQHHDWRLVAERHLEVFEHLTGQVQQIVPLRLAA